MAHTHSKSPLTGLWQTHLGAEFERDYMQNLKKFLQAEQAQGKKIYPANRDMFKAFELTPFEDVAVVILGQDPYHGPRQAHGLSFSVPLGVPCPPSLQNIYKELASDLSLKQPATGSLEAWARQGVLLLNSVLSVTEGQANAHQGKGWEQFTDRVFEKLNESRPNIVFMLWGAYARKKGQLIDETRHLVLHAPHPSPLSCHRGFFGCQHFSKANHYLSAHQREPIDWRLPSQI